jgi:hypothetical protein
MKKISLFAVFLAFGLCSCSTTSSGEKKDTYTMQKGGMSSQAHEMPASEKPACEKTDEECANKKKEGYTMQKGGMSSQTHEMK